MFCAAALVRAWMLQEMSKDKKACIPHNPKRPYKRARDDTRTCRAKKHFKRGVVARWHACAHLRPLVLFGLHACAPLPNCMVVVHARILQRRREDQKADFVY